MRYLKLFESFSDIIEKFRNFNYRLKMMPFSEEDYIKITKNLNPNKFDSLGKYIGDYTKKNNIEYGEVNSSYSKLYVLNLIKMNIFPNENPKLCDLGCGYGTVVYFCNKMGYESIGVEKEISLKEYHNKLGISVIYDDLLNMDLSFLKNMDVVYLYRPIKDYNLSEKLMKLVYDNTKDDVIIYYTMSHIGTGSDLFDYFIRIKSIPYGGDDIYVKNLF